METSYGNFDWSVFVALGYGVTALGLFGYAAYVISALRKVQREWKDEGFGSHVENQ